MTDDSWILTESLPRLWRAPGVLQVGLDAPTGIILEGVPVELTDVLAALTRGQRHDDLVRAAPSLEAGWIDWLLERLSEAGLVRRVPAECPSPLTVVGPGSLAALVAEQLLTAGVVDLELVDGRLRPPPGSRRRVDRELDRLRERHPSARITARTGSSGTLRAPSSLAVIAGQSCEPDRLLTDRFVRERQPHLVVRVEPGRGVVGPLVVPGSTPCLRCEDLHRTDRDAAWPRLLAQLCHQTPGESRLLESWAAVTAALQATAFLRGTAPETLGSTLEMSSRDWLGRVRPVRPHARCSCQWPPPADLVGTMAG